MGRNDILQTDEFFNMLMYAFQKSYDYLVFNQDNNEYYHKFNKISIVDNNK